MRDTISEEDMLVDVTKTELEKRLEKSDRDKELMKEELSSVRMQIKIMQEEFRKLKYNSIQIVELKNNKFN
jgi:hypothetical protein